MEKFVDKKVGELAKSRKIGFQNKHFLLKDIDANGLYPTALSDDEFIFLENEV